MEELRSTEILDKEIQEDARRKANRILNNGILECEKILEDVNLRFEKDAETKKLEYENKIESFKKNKEASIPLEKQRFLVDFENQSVDRAITQYLEKLSTEQKLSIIENMVEKFSFSLKDKKINIIINDFEKKEIKKIVSKFVLEKNIISIENSNNQNLEFFRGCIITSEDLKIKCRATLEEKVTELKDKYSEELALTLFGGRLPQ